MGNNRNPSQKGRLGLSMKTRLAIRPARAIKPKLHFGDGFNKVRPPESANPAGKFDKIGRFEPGSYKVN